MNVACYELISVLSKVDILELEKYKCAYCFRDIGTDQVTPIPAKLVWFYTKDELDFRVRQDSPASCTSAADLFDYIMSYKRQYNIQANDVNMSFSIKGQPVKLTGVFFWESKYFVLYFSRENEVKAFSTIDNCLKKDNDNKSTKAKGGNNMANGIGNALSTVVSMKMLKSVMRDGKEDMDLGKLFMLQAFSQGEKIEVTDMLKAKLMSEFDLSGKKKDLSLEKVLLLQMLDSGTIDIGQLLAVKMLGEEFSSDDKEDK